MSPERRRRHGLTSLSGRVMCGVVSALLVVVAASSLLVVTFVRWNDASRDARSLGVARGYAAQAAADVLVEQNALLNHVITADPAQRLVIDERAGSFVDEIARVRSALVSLGVDPADVDAVRAAHTAWLDDVITPTFAAAAAGDAAGTRAAATGPGAVARSNAVRESVGRLWAELNTGYSAGVDTALGIRHRLMWVFGVVVTTYLAALIGTWMLVRRAVVLPLRRLQSATQDVTAGEWDTAVEVDGPDEIVAVGHDVDRMRRAALEAWDAERRAAEALDQHGPAVAAVRQALAPAPWEQFGFESAGRLDPVEGWLAGDWYEVIELDQHRVGVVLGDVAGHGATSGVYALRLKIMLRTALLHGLSPGAAIADVAAQVRRFPGDARIATGELFATVFVAVADREVGQLTYASAGHLEAVLMRAVPDGGVAAADTVRFWDHLDLPPTGPMLSTLLADRVWAERRHRFTEQDLLVAATDGVIEARGAGDVDVEYGLDRLVARVGARLTVGDDLGRAVDAVFADVAGFERHARDDRTLVALRQSSVRRRFGSTRVSSAGPVRS